MPGGAGEEEEWVSKPETDTQEGKSPTWRRGVGTCSEKHMRHFREQCGVLGVQPAYVVDLICIPKSLFANNDSICYILYKLSSTTVTVPCHSIRVAPLLPLTFSSKFFMTLNPKL